MTFELLNTTVLSSMIALAIGFGLDLVFGDPHWMPHPICLIGNMISTGERIIRKVLPKTEKGELAGGVLFVIIVAAASTVVPFAVLWAAGKIHILLRIGLEAIMCYQILSVKSLKTESMKVYHELIRKDLAGARKMVSMIVGRDVQNLDLEQITKAAVETVAENTSDGTVAPLLFMALGGAPLGFFYKAINTMDSMIGYKNDQYLYFGRFAAKLDDFVNYIPARISAFLMIFASCILNLDYRNAYRIFKRDRYNHASPNSAQTESVCAGALDIQLAGDAYYFGKLYPKKTIGDPLRPIVYDDICLANRLLYGTAYLTFTLCIIGMGVAVWII
ncbi:MAG TPA: adenosylcobinamide-phosphate synthase CbiB [Anaerovoracaceae bacterium]|nr:adenosylcobinamide-phosphate synthase CbiB [Anaerovoracaceae bacterium]